MNVFEYTSYRNYLKIRLGDGQRLGLKKQAAEALRVHTTLISQILSEKCEISLEQAEDMNRFLGHTEDEGDYFISLVLKDRAGTSALKKRLERQAKLQREKRLKLSERMKGRDQISEDDKERFYSTYLHGAVHVMSSIPGFQTRAALAKAFGATASQIAEAVDFLLRLGVLKEVDGKLSPGQNHIHLESGSRHIVKHHLNWRLKSIEKINEAPQKDLHYSVVFSLSKNDAEKIQEMILKKLEEISKVVAASPEETAYVYCFDFFELANATET